MVVRRDDLRVDLTVEMSDASSGQCWVSKMVVKMVSMTDVS